MSTTQNGGAVSVVDDCDDHDGYTYGHDDRVQIGIVGVADVVVLMALALA
jgi:hypothetical protein